MIECCTNCNTHAWNTRHDEAKYANYANAIAAQIQINHPNTVVLFNQVPKTWHEKEIYCQLIQNSDDQCDVYDIVPRLGAFEVSTVFTGVSGRSIDILFFSKILSHLWPHL